MAMLYMVCVSMIARQKYSFDESDCDSLSKRRQTKSAVDPLTYIIFVNHL